MEMASENILQKKQAGKLTRRKNLIEITCMYRNSCFNSKCICGLWIRDSSSTDYKKNQKIKQKEVCFVESNPT